MKTRRLVWTLAAVVVLVAMGNVYAGSVLVREGELASYGYGHSSWTNMTAELDTATGGNVTVTANLLNLADMLNYDALWVDLINTTLPAAETNNIAAYIATGRCVVMIGENYLWTGWNAQITALGGGSYGGAWLTGSTNTALVHDLTAGVSDIWVQAGGIAVGGTSLFDDNVATLWHGGTMLSILDTNIFDDAYWGNQDNAVFARNTAQGIANCGGGQDIPEPTTLVMLALAGAGLALRKRLVS